MKSGKKIFFGIIDYWYIWEIDVAQIDLTHQLIGYATDLLNFEIVIYMSGDKREEYSRSFINTCKR